MTATYPAPFRVRPVTNNDLDVVRTLLRDAVLLKRPSAAGVADVYLLTETAPGFFERLGFQPISRAEAPAAIRGTRKFTTPCPDSAVLMWCVL